MSLQSDVFYYDTATRHLYMFNLVILYYSQVILLVLLFYSEPYSVSIFIRVYIIFFCWKVDFYYFFCFVMFGARNVRSLFIVWNY